MKHGAGGQRLPDGCTACGSTDTVTMDGVHGRRCASCPPTYSRAHALRLVDAGQVATACAHLRTHLAWAASRWPS